MCLTGADTFRWYGMAHAALFDAGHDAAISHGAAARLHRMPGYFANQVEILVPRALDHRCTIAVVHESRRFDRIPTTEVNRLRVITPEATVVMLAAGMRIGRLVVRRRADRRQEGRGAAAPCRVSRHRRPWRVRLGPTQAVLDERLPGDPIPESRLERMFLRFCDKYVIQRPKLQCPLPWAPTRGRVDGIFEPQKVIVEVDGRRWHTRVADLERDHRRDLQAAAMGYRVVRITYLMMRYDEVFLQRELKSALRVAAA